MDILLGLAAVALVSGTSLTLGAVVWRWIGVPFYRCLLCELSLGLALTSYLLLAIAALGGLSKTVVLVVFGAICILGLVTQKIRWTEYCARIREGGFPTADGLWERSGWVLILFTLMAALVEALAPATTPDALSYHLRIPYDYVEAGGIIYSPFQPYNMPHLIQMLITVPFLFGAGDVGAHLLYFVFCVIFVAALFRLARECFDRKTTLLAVLLIISTPMFTYIKVSGRVEVGLTAVIFLSLWALIKGVNEDEKYRYRWLIASGFFMGVSAGIKYYGLFSGACACFLIVIISLRQAGGKLAIRSSMYFLAGLLVFGLPFYIKNIIMTGNPFYPALFELLGGRDWSGAMAQLTKSYFEAYKYPAGKGVTDLLLSPWRLTMDGERFIAGRTGYGFIYLALFPLLFVGVLLGIKRTGWRALLPTSSVCSVLVWFGILFWVLWFFMAFQRGRHLMPVFGILSILTAGAATTALMRPIKESGDKFFKYAVGAILGSGLFLQLLIAGFFTATYIPVAFGLEKRDVFLARIHPMWADYQAVDQILPQNAKVLHLFGDAQYYLKREQFYPSPYFQGSVDWARIPDVSAYRNQLRAAGFTHVIGSAYDVDRTKEATIEEIGRENIDRFNELNRELILRFTKKLYESTRLVPDGRTAPIETKGKTFVLYELR
jgi:4-amino-4-deoxy-L-arabinose transferase-like glycosyltransferase